MEWKGKRNKYMLVEKSSVMIINKHLFLLAFNSTWLMVTCLLYCWLREIFYKWKNLLTKTIDNKKEAKNKTFGGRDNSCSWSQLFGNSWSHLSLLQYQFQVNTNFNCHFSFAAMHTTSMIVLQLFNMQWLQRSQPLFMKTCENEKLLNPAANNIQFHSLKVNFLHPVFIYQIQFGFSKC